MWMDIPHRLALGILQIFQLALLLPMHIAWLGTQLAFHAAFSDVDPAFGLAGCQVERSTACGHVRHVLGISRISAGLKWTIRCLIACFLVSLIGVFSG